MNKKITLAIFTCLITAVSFAQISKGTTFIGGNAGLNVYSSKYEQADSYTSTSYSLSPTLGFAYRENHVFGFLLRYQHAGFNQGQALNLYGAGIFLRQYKPLGKGFYVFAQEAVNFNYTKYNPDSIYNNNINKSINISVNLNPGLAYDLTKKMQVELLFNDLINIGYNYDKYRNPYNYKQSNFYVNSSFNLSQLSSINLGIRFLLGRG